MKTGIENLLAESPFPCEFKKGDKVIYTNDAGIEFNMIVVGFTSRKNSDGTDWPEDYLLGRFINISRDETGEGSAWWFPCKSSELRKVEYKQEILQAQAMAQAAFIEAKQK